MRVRSFAFLSAICLLLLAFVTPLPAAFQTSLTAARMSCAPPAGWPAVKVLRNQPMDYDYAVKHPTRKFEVRYALRPLAAELREYEAGKKRGEVAVHPNQFHSMALQALLLNISGGQDAPVEEYTKQAVRQEFNADWGATSLVNVSPAFAPGYQYCMVVALHKDNVAEAYCFYLANSKADLLELMPKAFHALRFR